MEGLYGSEGFWKDLAIQTAELNLAHDKLAEKKTNWKTEKAGSKMKAEISWIKKIYLWAKERLFYRTYRWN
jgi:hypothetical protein